LPNNNKILSQKNVISGFNAISPGDGFFLAAADIGKLIVHIRAADLATTSYVVKAIDSTWKRISGIDVP
jgi:hypothetical protein